MSWHSDARTVLSEQLFGDAGLAQDPGHWPWTFVGSLGLLAALTWAVLALPVAAQLGIVIGIAGSLFTLARPGLMVATFFMIRILMDLMWWIPGSIAGLNLMELYTGSATVLSAGLVLLHFKRVERHPALIPFIIYSMVLVIGGARNIELRTGAEIFARYLSPFIIMFAVSGLMKTREDRRRFIYAMTAVCAIPVAISLYQLARGQQYKFFLQGLRNNSPQVTQVRPPCGFNSMSPFCYQCLSRQHSQKECPKLNRVFSWPQKPLSHSSSALPTLYRLHPHTQHQQGL